ncbi:MAG: hypothetical protein C4293_00425 [Nitrospiraceae bacterium]
MDPPSDDSPIARKEIQKWVHVSELLCDNLEKNPSLTEYERLVLDAYVMRLRSHLLMDLLHEKYEGVQKESRLHSKT